jgi:rfaE bifunctional protein nucleotidyltransferase chain/domain/rfaE bifunctional protein kinase chain/domain
VVGDSILDRDVDGSVTRVAPDAPAPVVDVASTDERPGGAALAALLLHRQGARVTLATCLGDDAAGARVRELLEGVEVVTLGVPAATRTVTRVRSGATTLVRLDTPAPPPDGALDAGGLAAALAGADAVLVADYGRGVAADAGVRAALSAAGRPLVWDPHPRGPAPAPGTAVATPNRAEVTALTSSPRLDVAAGELRQAWDLPALVATDGERGAVVVDDARPPVFVPAPRAVAGDACGAGDRFAGTVALALAGGAPLVDAVGAAVHDVARWLASGGVTAESHTLDRDHARPVGELNLRDVHDHGIVGGEHRHEEHDRGRSAASVRDHARRVGSGSTLVATGGCFDVLHAGHVASLEAARRLGDRLVVLLNSDASVRRLKGPSRPVNGVADRRRVLESLACVDEVVVFDEDDPRAALSRLRPDIWAKGGDYDVASLPEAALLPEWGGRVVLLPHLPDRSTTRILDHARRSRTHRPSQTREPQEASS